ncbi:MAG: hypothetical protein LUE61_00255 [Clostridiales bacterium]|nr:hypothetical protein [Clostridiales bacterium]
MKKLIFEEPKFEAVLFRTDDVAVVASSLGDGETTGPEMSDGEDDPD